MTHTKHQIPNIKFQIALAMGLALVILFAPAPLTRAAPQERQFRIAASRYQYTPSVISVNPGDKVTIDLTTTDVVHGLYVDAYALDITADPGQTTRLTFVADKPGTFALRCPAPCGPVHPFMVGKLNVGPNWFLWRAMGAASLAALTGLWMLKR
jgi:heme/copper-type cytochrome/quinol oxidase subunit 2